MTSVRTVWGSSKWCIYRTCLQLIFQHSSVRLYRVQRQAARSTSHLIPLAILQSQGNLTVERSWPLAPVSLETRVNAHLGPSTSYKKNLFKPIGFRQKSCHSSYCQNFQSCWEPHTRQRSKSVRYTREILFQELLRRTVLFTGCWLVSPQSSHDKGKFKMVSRK